MRRAVLAVAVLASVLAAPAATGHPGHAPPTVSVAVYSYSPADTTITQGDVVIWNFDGPDYSHSVTTEKDAPEQFDSGVRKKQGSFEFYFSKPGTYKYFCTIHGNMHGTVTVMPNDQQVDTVAPTLSKAKLAGQTRKRARFSFSVDEDVSVTTELRRKGASKVLRQSFGFVKTGAGKASLKLGGLPKGGYVATLVAGDATGNKSTPAKVKVKR